VNPPISQKKWVGHPGLTVKVKWVGHPAPRFNRQGKMGGAPGRLGESGVFFVTRIKSNILFEVEQYFPVIRVSGMTHVRTSPFYPQSNGKKERWYQTLKKECIRPKTPLSLAEARRVVGEYVEHYNHVRLHSAIGYITPADKLAGREQEIWAERDRKLEAAREERKARRQAARVASAPVDIDSRMTALV